MNGRVVVIDMIFYDFLFICIIKSRWEQFIFNNIKNISSDGLQFL